MQASVPCGAFRVQHLALPSPRQVINALQNYTQPLVSSFISKQSWRLEEVGETVVAATLVRSLREPFWAALRGMLSIGGQCLCLQAGWKRGLMDQLCLNNTAFGSECSVPSKPSTALSPNKLVCFYHGMDFVPHPCSFCLLLSPKASNPLYRKPISTHNVEFTFNKLNKSYNGTVD